MPLSPFTIGGQVNPAAVLEHTSIIAAVYWNSRPALTQIIGEIGGGTILAYNWSTEGIPVSYVIWQQGSQINVDITGTVNKAQMIANVVGAFGQPYLGASGFVHNFFLNQATAVYAALQSVLPYPWTAYHFNLCGHSLGGSTAWILGQFIARDTSSSQVSVIGLGSPKSTTKQFSSVKPAEDYMVAMVDDPVSYLPPVSPGIFLLLSPISVNAAKSYAWQHQSDCYTLDPSGDLTSVSADSFNGIPALSVWRNGWSQHLFQAYGLGVIAWWQKTQVPPQDAGLPQILVNLINLPDEQNGSQDFSSLATIDIPALNSDVFVGSNTSPVETNNLQLLTSVAGSAIWSNSRHIDNIGDTGGSMASQATSGLFKVSFIFSDGTYGASESHVYSGATTNSLDDILTIAKPLAAQRATLLGSLYNATPANKTIGAGSPALNWIRVSDLLNPKLSLLSNALSLFGENNTVVKPATFPSIMVSKQMSCVDKTPTPGTGTNRSTRANLLITFPPSDIQSNEAYNPNCQVAGGGVATLYWWTLYQNYLNTLSAVGTNWGIAGLAASEQKYVANNWAVAANGIWSFQSTATYNTGDVVRVTHANTRGFNGVYSITAGAVSAGVTTYSVNSYINSKFIPPTYSRVQRIRNSLGVRIVDFYPYTSWDQQFPTLRKKDPGRAFKRATFRRRKPRPI